MATRRGDRFFWGAPVARARGRTVDGRHPLARVRNRSKFRWRPRSSVGTPADIRSFCCLAYCEVKIAFGIMPWMPLVPSTTWVT